MTSAHPRFDTRIFVKECRSLSRSGHTVHLIVADGKGDEEKEGVGIFDVGRPKGRLDRIFRTTRLVYARAMRLDADVYHIHDPELMPAGLRLAKARKKVIFDAHEDLPSQLLSKAYIPRPLRCLLSFAARLYERRVTRRFHMVIAATPHIRDKFDSMGVPSVDVNNYPVLGELSAESPGNEQREDQVCYVGGLARIRGIREMVEAINLVGNDTRLQIAGDFRDPAFRSEIEAVPGWGRVDHLGWMDRLGVKRVLGRSVAGLVTLHPRANYLQSLPVKMFEYMSAGLPVIASRFPLWVEIVEGNQCGLCVDPLDPREIANAIAFLCQNPLEARRMGENGRAAVAERYNWTVEEAKLVVAYDNLEHEE